MIRVCAASVLLLLSSDIVDTDKNKILASFWEAVFWAKMGGTDFVLSGSSQF
jgi:hypothetical protein